MSRPEIPDFLSYLSASYFNKCFYHLSQFLISSLIHVIKTIFRKQRPMHRGYSANVGTSHPNLPTLSLSPARQVLETAGVLPVVPRTEFVDTCEGILLAREIPGLLGNSLGPQKHTQSRHRRARLGLRLPL